MLSTIYNSDSFFLIAGPCVIENNFDDAFIIAQHIKKVCDKLSIPYIFKASYRKANRTSLDSFQGIGDQEALHIIQRIGNELGIPTTTDIHAADEATMAASFVDILQIPAFLCRQTDILLAAAQTDKVVNIKKGQFLSGQSMKFAVNKIRQSVGDKAPIWLTERGNSFGYQDLVVDFKNITLMKKFDVPVIMDCTHSLQQPNKPDGVTGGDPSMIATIAKAAIAVGVDGIFIETHPNPDKAKSDGKNMLKLDLLEDLLADLLRIYKAK